MRGHRKETVWVIVAEMGIQTRRLGLASAVVGFGTWFISVVSRGWKRRRHRCARKLPSILCAGTILCDGCRERAPQFSCKRCYFARYCSSECESAHWVACHRHECFPCQSSLPQKEHAQFSTSACMQSADTVLGSREELRLAVACHSSCTKIQFVSRLEKASKIAQMSGPDHFVLGEVSRLLALEKLDLRGGGVRAKVADCHDEVLQYITSAFSSARQIPADDLERAVLTIRCLVTRGCIHRSRDNDTAALRDFTEATQLARAIDFGAEEASALSYIGVIKTLRGDMLGAEKALSRCLSLRKANAMRQLAYIEALSRPASVALKNNHNLLEEFRRCANVAHNLGSVLVLCGKPEGAEVAFYEALEMSNASRDPVITCMALAACANNSRDWDEHSQKKSVESWLRLENTPRAVSSNDERGAHSNKWSKCHVCKKTIWHTQNSPKKIVLPCCFRICHRKCLDRFVMECSSHCPHVRH